MLEEGDVIGEKYRIVRPIGAGGMGEVYESVHLHTGKHVAVKVLLGDRRPEAVVRFQREARIASQIETQHIVQVIDAGIDQATSQPFMAMELLRGEDLRRLVDRVGPVLPEVVARIASQACVGLARAHAAGVVHRDIKSANLFLAETEGAAIVVKILDFGIAKAQASSAGTDLGLTRTGAMLGSPIYMSPEQLAGDTEIDARTDIWSLGVVMYEALAGHAPHGHHTAFPKLVMAICNSDAPPLVAEAPWVEPALAAVVHRALSIEPRDRFASADELRAALRPFVADVTTLRSVEMRGAATLKDLSDRVSVRAPGAISSDFATTELQPAATGITARSSRSTARPSAPRTTRTGVIVGVVAIAALLAVIAVRGRTRGSDDPIASTTAPARASPPSPVSSQVRVDVRIEPSSASVTVDGDSALVSAGSVRIAGELGSVHHVVVRAGDATTERDVVISASGAFPSSVGVAMAPSAAPSVARPTGSARTTTSATAPRAVPSSAPPTPPVPKKRVDATEGFE